MQDKHTLEEGAKISGYEAKVGTVFMLASFSKLKKNNIRINDITEILNTAIKFKHNN